jgi:hypothetical protein
LDKGIQLVQPVVQLSTFMKNSLLVGWPFFDFAHGGN